MTSSKHGLGQLICGTGGALVIVSLLLPCTGGAAVDLSGWELRTMADVFFLLIVGLVAIAMALMGGRVGLFPRSFAERRGRSARAGRDGLAHVARHLRLPRRRKP